MKDYVGKSKDHEMWSHMKGFSLHILKIDVQKDKV